ncbi:MAG TPA: hypothetical protein PK765_04215 [bacterium]|nr:hypothetical protein [bacterium]
MPNAGTIGFLFEDALKWLASRTSEESEKKPSFFHSVRVGVRLYEDGYDEPLAIA